MVPGYADRFMRHLICKDKVDHRQIQLPKPGEGYKVNMEAAKKFRNYWAHKNTGKTAYVRNRKRHEVEQYSDGTPVEAVIWIRSVGKIL